MPDPTVPAPPSPNEQLAALIAAFPTWTIRRSTVGDWIADHELYESDGYVVVVKPSSELLRTRMTELSEQYALGKDREQPPASLSRMTGIDM